MNESRYESHQNRPVGALLHMLFEMARQYYVKFVRVAFALLLEASRCASTRRPQEMVAA